MRKLLILLALIGGCNSESNEPVRHDSSTIIKTDGGIEIQTNGFDIPSTADIDAWYKEVEECIGYSTNENPVISFTDGIEDICNVSDSGCYLAGLEIIAISSTAPDVKRTLKHEFIHHDLYMNDYPPELEINHQPEFIWNCQLL